jgi:hypothetical protein
LLHSISATLEDIGTHRVLITKVAAHQEHDGCTSALESWCYLYNGLVDHAARAAHLLRPHSFWDIHQKFVHDQALATHINAQVRTVQLAISQAVVYHQQTTVDVGEGLEEPRADHSTPCSMRPVWQAPPEVTWVAGELCSKYGERLVKQVTRWFLQGVRSATTSAEWIHSTNCMQIISFAQGREVHCVWIGGLTH